MQGVAKIDISVVRGDTFDLLVTLNSAYEDVIAAPGSYELRIVFRDVQDDAIENALAHTASLSTYSDPLYPGAALLGDLTLSPAQTQTLPTYDHVYFVELRKPTGTEIRRLFEGKVKVKD